MTISVESNVSKGETSGKLALSQVLFFDCRPAIFRFHHKAAECQLYNALPDHYQSTSGGLGQFIDHRRQTRQDTDGRKCGRRRPHDFDTQLSLRQACVLGKFRYP